MKKEFIYFEGSVRETQDYINKIIREGYKIKIIMQIKETEKEFNETILFTTLWRWKKELKKETKTFKNFLYKK